MYTLSTSPGVSLAAGVSLSLFGKAGCDLRLSQKVLNSTHPFLEQVGSLASRHSPPPPAFGCVTMLLVLLVRDWLAAVMR